MSTLRPSHVLDPLWRLLQSAPSGLVQVCGASGTGRSTLLSHLEVESRARSLAVVRCGLGHSPTLNFLRTFLADQVRGLGARAILAQLAYRAAVEHGLETREAQVAACLCAEPADSLREFLATLMEANDLERLVVLLDDADVFSHSLGTSRACSAALTEATLPPGCHVVVTLENAWNPSGLGTFSLDGLEHRRFLARLAAVRRPQSRERDELLEASAGKAVYLELLLAGLEQGLVRPGELPHGSQIVPALMDALREHVGEDAYRQQHLPALHLLTAARQAVSPALLRRWGLSEEGLQLALFDLRPFLSGISLDSPQALLHSPPLTLAHPRVRQDVLSHPGWRIPMRWAEHQIARSRPAWGDESPSWYDHCVKIFEREHGGLGERPLGPCANLPALLREEAELYLYHLLFTQPHLERTSEEARRLRQEPRYAKELWRLGIRSFRTSPLSASYLLGACCSLFAEMGNQEEELAGRLLDLSAVLSNLEWFSESARSSRTSCGVFCQLLERGSTGVKGSLARSLKNLGVSLRALRQPEEADLAYRAAARLLRELDRTGELATLLINRGNALWDIGLYGEALECLEESLRLLRSQTPVDEAEVAAVLELLADRLEDQEQLERALQCCDEALAILRDREEGGPRLRAMLLRRGCLLAQRVGRELPDPHGCARVEAAFRSAAEVAGAGPLDPEDCEQAARSLDLIESPLAIDYFEQAAQAYELRVAQGRGRLRRNLALCLWEVGKLRRRFNQPGAGAPLTRARGLLEQLCQQGHEDLASVLGACTRLMGG